MPRLMFLLFLLFALPWPALAATDEARVPVAFTQADRDRLIRLEATLETFMHQVDKRFEELQASIDKRFEAVDKRFEEVHNRLNDCLPSFGFYPACSPPLPWPYLGLPGGTGAPS